MRLGGLDWALCPAFLAILREGSLSGAARVLGVAHPTIRRHLDELERAMGATLFVRSPSGLIPTDLALQLREPAEDMEAAAYHLVRTASARAADIAGTVRISASEVVGAEVIPGALTTLRARHPALVFELRLTNAIDDVLRRDVEIAIRMVRPTQADLIVRRVGAVPLGFYAHRRWLATHGTPASLEELVNTSSLLGYDRDPAMIDALRRHGARATRRAFAFRSDSDLAQLAMLRAGFGVGICQGPLARRSPDLCRVLPEVEAEMEVWLVTHPNLAASARVRVTADGLAHALAAYVAGDA